MFRTFWPTWISLICLEKLRDLSLGPMTLFQRPICVSIRLRWLYDRRDLAEARRDLTSWLKKWQQKYPRLCDWVESNIEETLSFYRLPRQHHKHMKSTNMLERLNEEIKRRTHVVRIFPNRQSCLRLIRALATEPHENWIEATRYLNMSFLREKKKETMRHAAA